MSLSVIEIFRMGSVLPKITPYSHTKKVRNSYYIIYIIYVSKYITILTIGKNLKVTNIKKTIENPTLKAMKNNNVTLVSIK